MKQDIYFFYSGGLKREIYLVNNLVNNFNKIYLITVDSDKSKLLQKSNLIFKKFYLLKVLIFILNLLKFSKSLKKFLNLFSLLFIDIFFSFYLIIKKTSSNDIIVCENNICNLLLKIAKAKKLKTILDVSNIHISEKFKIIQNIRGSKITFPEKIILNRGLNEYHLADKITILSNNVLRSFKINNPGLLNKLFLTPSGVDTKVFFRRIIPYQYSLCIIGAISKYKNSHKLFEAINSITKIKLKILIVGNFDETMKDINLSNHDVTHKSYVNHIELPNLYSSSKILCIASYIEGMPKVVLEASACGTPVIGFEGSSIDDIIINEKNGYIIKNNNFEDFKNKILLSINNDLTQMNIFGSNIIKEKYSLKNYAYRFDQVIKNI